MYFPSKVILQLLREQYPAGTRVELVRMNDPYTTLQPGDRGTVQHVDDMATIFCSWDKGSSLGVAYGEDMIKKLDSV